MRRSSPKIDPSPLPMILSAAAWVVVAALPSAACDLSNRRDDVYSGTIEAVEVDVMPEVSGRIVERPVDQGDHVEKGATIALIDRQPYEIAMAETEAALAEAKARFSLLTAGYRDEEIEAAARDADEAKAHLDQAESRIERVERLVDQKISSQDDLDVARRDRDAARARAEAARARLALLVKGYRREEVEQARAEVARLEAVLDSRRLDLSRTTVTSPLAGTVTEKLAEPGEQARPGSPIVSVADLENLYTWVYLGEADLPRVRVGEAVSVRVDGLPGRDFPGKIVYVSKVAEFTPKNVQTVEDRVQLVFGVKVSVRNPDGALKVGIPADVLLRSESPQSGDSQPSAGRPGASP